MYTVKLKTLHRNGDRMLVTSTWLLTCIS